MTTNNGNDANQPQTISWQGFRIPSQDHHGHSERLWFRTQPGHARQISQIVASKIWPYRDSGDLIRHALDRHLHWLDTLIPLPSVTKQVDAILELVREEEFNTDFRTVFDKVQQQVSVYVGMGADQDARRLVSSVKQYIEDMPPGNWRDRYKKELNEKFGHLMTNARGVGLTEFAVEEV